MVLFALLLADVLMDGRIAQADTGVGARVVGLAPFEGLARAMAFVGESELVIGATVLLSGILLALRRRWGAIRVLGVVGGTYLATTIMKLAVGRARPDFAIDHAAGFAFPSGHAASAAALAVLLAWFATRNLRGRLLVSGALLFAVAWAVLMAFSRMVLGVHYLSDVVGGLALGAGVAGLALGASLPAEARVPLTRGRARP